MNVLLLSQGYKKKPKEATGITLSLLAKELKEKGCDVTIISDNTEDDKRYKKTERDGVEIHQFKAGGKDGALGMANDQVLRYLLSARKIRSRPDIIHGFSSAPALAVRTVLCGLMFPKARTVHTIKSYSRVRGARFRLVSALKLVRCVTVPTMVLKDSLEKRGIRDVRVIRSPINIERFKPQDRERLKKRYGYQGKKIVLYYGAMFHNKGAHILAQAMPKIISRHKDALFLFAPRHGGEQVEQVKTIAGKGRNEFLMGDIKIEDYVAMADCVALPYVDISGTEGNPSCLLEAAACKTTVITTDIPELREIMGKGKDILMAKPGDPESLAHEIMKALSDPALRERLSNNAYRKIGQFDAKKIGMDYHNLYKSLSNT